MVSWQLQMSCFLHLLQLFTRHQHSTPLARHSIKCITSHARARTLTFSCTTYAQPSPSPPSYLFLRCIPRRSSSWSWSAPCSRALLDGAQHTRTRLAMYCCNDNALVHVPSMPISSPFPFRHAHTSTLRAVVLSVFPRPVFPLRSLRL
ncbi:hypothetical protein EXIGLDRAFT_499541 [Exidia glandulosa HHB12029]|uniref:Secreted protein n=1 Tax=Exidia glandulosa HHB12029 TaxID=1314781 RepID=A0A166N7S3_EXIGL|nr:hypothetical protein EXIGLDRAFT_499541 [Exidia glandulosa HHB12029]